MSELHEQPGGLLDIGRARSLERQSHDPERSGQIAGQLAAVGDARVARGVRPERGRAVERGKSEVVVAELHARVAKRGMYPRACRVSRRRALGIGEGVGESMLREQCSNTQSARVRAIRLGQQHGAQHALRLDRLTRLSCGPRLPQPRVRQTDRDVAVGGTHPERRFAFPNDLLERSGRGPRGSRGAEGLDGRGASACGGRLCRTTCRHQGRRDERQRGGSHYLLPGCGDARYGNTAMNGLSFAATPSPSWALMPALNCGVSGVAPAMARRAMSTTSSVGRRPLGNPATSPPSTPNGFGCSTGETATLRRSNSAGVTLAGWLSPGMPVRKMVTRSWRGAAGDWMPKSSESSLGTSGSRTNGSAAASPVGSRELKRSFAPRGITTSFTRGWPRRETCTMAPLAFSAPALRTVTDGRLAVDQTPITALGSLID